MKFITIYDGRLTINLEQIIWINNEKNSNGRYYIRRTDGDIYFDVNEKDYQRIINAIKSYMVD